MGSKCARGLVCVCLIEATQLTKHIVWKLSGKFWAVWKTSVFQTSVFADSLNAKTPFIKVACKRSLLDFWHGVAPRPVFAPVTACCYNSFLISLIASSVCTMRCSLLFNVFIQTTQLNVSYCLQTILKSFVLQLSQIPHQHALFLQVGTHW